MADSVQHLAYELTRGSLSEQEQRLSDLRTRAGTILAAASIAGSFLAAKNGSIDTPAILAIVAYVACVGAAVYVLLPHELVLEFRGSVVNELEYERGGGLDAAYEAVTEWLEDFHESNAFTLRELGRWSTIACAGPRRRSPALDVEHHRYPVVMASGANSNPRPAPTPWPKTPPPGFGISEKRGGSNGGKK